MSTVQRAASLADFARRPRGRALAGTGWLSFCVDADLWGFALWGRANGSAMDGLLPALELELADATPPHASLVDASRLDDADAASFEALGRYVERHREALARKVRALAIVHPRGFQGAVVSGFFRVNAPPYPVTLATDVAQALADLGRPDARLATELASLVDDTAQSSPLLTALRAALSRRPTLSLEAAARVVQLAPRTLQRRLDEHGTTFKALAADVRLSRAIERITGTAEPFTAIALDVGFASPQHMSRAVKHSTGLTPSALRARGRQ